MKMLLIQREAEIIFSKRAKVSLSGVIYVLQGQCVIKMEGESEKVLVGQE